jgi:hypothetical protein
MHSFQFSKTTLFTCSKPDSSLIFYPNENNKFHWYGTKLDKLGNYSFFEKDQLYLELQWNYGREQTYIVVSTNGSNDDMTEFVLMDNKNNCAYKFSKDFNVLF